MEKNNKDDLNPSIKISGNGQHGEICIELRKAIVAEISLPSDIPGRCRKTLCSFRSDSDITLDDLGNIAKTIINQLPKHRSENSEYPDIRLLLRELQKVIETNNLSGDDKTIALLGIIILANSAKRPEAETSKKAAWKAITILREIIQLPPLKLTAICA